MSPSASPRGPSIALLLWVALAVIGGWTPGPARADIGSYRVSDAASVYFGNQRLFSRPCVIQADRVYRAIAEYREILEKGLTDKDVRYHFLMKKTAERFTEAVKAAARDLDVDLVAEVGSVKPAKKDVAQPAERTDDVISRLR